LFGRNKNNNVCYAQRQNKKDYCLDGNCIDLEEDFIIRNALHKDLPEVARIIVESFYVANPMFNSYHFLRELARVQNNFPYADENHIMLVACSKETGEVVGFCDLDNRPPKIANPPPRPYLSDLAVSTTFRRKGVASALVIACEVKSEDHWKKPFMYLRVEAQNKPALHMYSNLGYVFEEHSYFGVKDTTMLLRRDFVESTSTTTKMKAPAAEPIIVL